MEKLPINDVFSQWLQKIRMQSSEYITQRTKEIKNCDHLFVKLKQESRITSPHSSDCYFEPSEMECVHCGLTNKYWEMEELYDPNIMGFFYDAQTLESKLFSEIYKEDFQRGGKSFDESGIPFLSEEVLQTNHPGLLYRISLLDFGENPDVSLEEIFAKMKQIHALETDEERLCLKTIDQAQDLINRYQESKSKVLVKK